MQTDRVIIGVGIDVVPVERFAESLSRTPGLRDRLFTAAEQHTPSGAPRTGESLAARFAAKEALAKALGAPGDLHWHDAEVTVGEHGRPRAWPPSACGSSAGSTDDGSRCWSAAATTAVTPCSPAPSLRTAGHG